MITVEIIIVILAVLAAAGIGVAAWMALKSRNDVAQAQIAGESAKGIITQAEEESRKVLLAAQEEVSKLRNTTESDLKDQRQEFHRMESRHLQREEQLERKVEAQEERESELATKETEVEQTRIDADELKAEQSRALEKMAGLSVDEAREQVVKRGEEEAVHDL
ncbi:MAG: Rnase Y domain-containing protein, partial [Dehalococcoidia bacterium]